MLEEAKYLVDTDDVAKRGFEHAQESNQHFSITLPQCFDHLYYSLSYNQNLTSGKHLIGYWYGRIVNPNRPKDM